MKEKAHVDSPNQIFNLHKIKVLAGIFIMLSYGFAYSQNPNANENATVYGGEISLLNGETYIDFCVGDGDADTVDVNLENASGRVKQWIVTDDENNILALPSSPSDVNFDGAGVGTCRIWHLSYNGIKPLVDPSGQGKFTKNLADIRGQFHLSNYITVERFQQPTGGALEGGPFEFCVGDGEADNIPDGAITLSGNMGTNSTWIVTDDAGNILGMPPSPYVVNFDEAPAGTCQVWHLSYEDNVSFEGVTNANDLTGCFALTNPITINRFKQPTSGTLEGGPFEFCVGDGEADNIPEGAITLSGNMGTNSTWIVTDDAGNILGMPPSPYVVNFDEAPAGTCQVWHLSYEDNVSFEGVTNANDLTGCFALTNPITINRFKQPTSGTLEGGPFEFCVGDGEADNIPEGAITLSGNMGTNSAWIVTDDAGNILGMPPSPYVVNFDEAPAGTCQVWHLSYEDNVSFEGVTNANDLTGCFAFTNPISVIRKTTVGGTITGGPFEFIIDDVADNIAEGAITLSDNIGDNSQWVVTNEDATIILGLPGSYIGPDFNGAGVGVCKIWHLSYADGLQGLEPPTEGDHLLASLSGCFSLSNSITVTRTESSASRVGLFPNPSKGSVNVDLSHFGSEDVWVSIYSLQNVRLYNKDFSARNLSSNKMTTVNVSDYLDGIYFVSVTDAKTGFTVVKRLVVSQ